MRGDLDVVIRERGGLSVSLSLSKRRMETTEIVKACSSPRYQQEDEVPLCLLLRSSSTGITNGMCHDLPDISTFLKIWALNIQLARKAGTPATSVAVAITTTFSRLIGLSNQFSQMNHPRVTSRALIRVPFKL